MLVLSRGPSQTIVFPGCGITVHVLGLHSGRVKVGVEAPSDISIFRGELVDFDHSPKQFEKREPIQNSRSHLHEIRNVLHSILLGLQLCQHLFDKGYTDRAVSVLSTLRSELQDFDTWWSDRNVESRTRFVKPKTAGVADLRNVRVLIVEDRQIERDFLGRLLELNGCSCERASDGFEALDLLAHKTFDLAIVDIVMPHMDGAALSCEIRNSSRFDSMQLLSVSAISPIEAGEIAKKCRFDGWLPKPYDANALMWKIKELVS